MTTTTTNNRIKCVHCKKEYSVKFAYELKKRKYCSYNCYHNSLRGKKTGKDNPRWNGGGKEEIECKGCGKKFIAKKSNSRKRKFCCIECKGKYYSGENNPKYSGGKVSPTDLKTNVDWYKNNPAEYAKIKDVIVSPAAKPPTKKAAPGGVAPPAKGPTLNAQIKALLPPKGTPVTVPFDEENIVNKIDIQKLFRLMWRILFTKLILRNCSV